MGALDERPQATRSGRSQHYGGASGDMTDYQRESLDVRRELGASTDAFRSAETARKAEQAGQRAAATQSRFGATMDYKRGIQTGVQSRFEQSQALRQQAEERMQANQEEANFNAATRIKLDADKDARAIRHESNVHRDVMGFDSAVDRIEYESGGDPIKEAALTVAAARRFPLVSEDKRTLAQIEKHSGFLERNQVHPQLGTALWEVGAFDPASLPPGQARQYLGTIAAKYTRVAGDKNFRDDIKSKMDQVDAIERNPREVKDTIYPALQAAYKMSADNLAKAQDDRNAAQKALDEGTASDKSGAKAVIDKQDKIVTHWQKRFNEDEAALDENRGRKEKPAAAPSFTIGNPNGAAAPIVVPAAKAAAAPIVVPAANGAAAPIVVPAAKAAAAPTVVPAAKADTAGKPKAVKQNGVTYHLQPDGSYK